MGLHTTWYLRKLVGPTTNDSGYKAQPHMSVFVYKYNSCYLNTSTCTDTSFCIHKIESFDSSRTAILPLFQVLQTQEAMISNKLVLVSLARSRGSKAALIMRPPVPALLSSSRCHTASAVREPALRETHTVHAVQTDMVRSAVKELLEQKEATKTITVEQLQQSYQNFKVGVQVTTCDTEFRNPVLLLLDWYYTVVTVPCGGRSSFGARSPHLPVHVHRAYRISSNFSQHDVSCCIMYSITGSSRHLYEDGSRSV